ncbi:MAG TPA: ArsC/Spx/MgsR family protein [Mycobacteriales bacterium]|nr:ArsC/Spx/MgsR family protein [Mycobacteriales bacterium]HWA65090.1 ArsC/Spx/MgsR family protein [Mycobacteriales bacterium]
MEIWYNPRCSKCRIAKEAVESAGVDFNLRLYLDQPPTEAELRDVISRTGLEPWEICRTGDAPGLGVALPAKDAAHRDEWVSVMLANPPLIQRPLVIADDGTAYVARDEDAVAAAIDHSR